MSETRHSGCGFWLGLVLAVLTVVGISTQDLTSALHAVLPLPVPVTVQPQEANLPFMLEGNQIIYTYRSTLDRPCNYLIQGRILDAEANPVTDILVNIQLIEIEEVTPLAPMSFYPAWRAERNDPSLWVLLLPSSTFTYAIWLTSADGTTVSPTIYVLPQDCRHNVANLIFVQQQPIH